MLDHVTKELPAVVEAAEIPIVCALSRVRSIQRVHWSCRQDFARQSIFGHSMGGHGALTIYLNSLITSAKQYRSCSAFSPICEPSAVPWGQKAFSGYLAGGVEEGKESYDASLLVGKVKGAVNILIDYVCIFPMPSSGSWPLAGEHIRLDMLTVLPGHC